MHIPTHILSGWCVANLIPQFSARERLLAVFAASLPDLDGLGLLWSEDAYRGVHHIWGHNLLAAIVVSGLLSLAANRKPLCFLVCVFLFHLHLLMDFYGSGQGWGIAYGWPFSHHYFETANAWSLGGWQNYLTLALLVIWSWWLLRVKHRTPFEHLAPTVDRAFLSVFVPHHAKTN